jgi:hypothetical protein
VATEKDTDVPVVNAMTEGDILSASYTDLLGPELLTVSTCN